MRNTVFLALLLATAAPAQQFDWTGAVNTTYSTPGNWSPVGPPGSSATARFNLATAYNVSFTGNATVDAISVNNGSVTWNLGGFTYNAPNTTNSGIGGSLTVKSGTFNAGGLSTGTNSGTGGSLTLDFASTVTLGAGGFSVGSNDVGYLVVKGFRRSRSPTPRRSSEPIRPASARQRSSGAGRPGPPTAPCGSASTAQARLTSSTAAP